MVSGGKRKIENSARTMSRSRASSISSGMCLPPLGGAAGARSRDADEIAAVDSRSIFSIFCRFGTGPDMMGAGSSIKLQHTLAVTRPRRSMAGGAPPPGERRRRCFAVLGTTVVLHSVRCMSAGEAHECQIAAPPHRPGGEDPRCRLSRPRVQYPGCNWVNRGTFFKTQEVEEVLAMALLLPGGHLGGLGATRVRPAGLGRVC